MLEKAHVNALLEVHTIVLKLRSGGEISYSDAARELRQVFPDETITRNRLIGIINRCQTRLLKRNGPAFLVDLKGVQSELVPAEFDRQQALLFLQQREAGSKKKWLGRRPETSSYRSPAPAVSPSRSSGRQKSASSAQRGRSLDRRS